MRFQVPQFIEVEDKIFGPLTLKQFIYLAGGAGLSFLFYAMLNSLMLSILPILVIMAISAMLAFFRVNNRSFIEIVESAVKYYFGKKLYIWKKTDKLQPAAEQEAIKGGKNYASIMVPKISDSKLKDLTWSLDVQDSIYASTQSNKRK